ncbi:MAG TPA: hypothetical protein VJL82_09765 [Rhizomicrobium sp.]|nr:hypothetical protein [Rhizomicrobium sp.]
MSGPVHDLFTVEALNTGMLMAPEPDPFLQQMFARMSPGAKFTFTPAQIDEIKKAFSARSHTSHALDFRRSICLFGKSYYLVLLAGGERRFVPRAPWSVTKLSQTIAACAATAACCLFFATLL